MTKRSDAKAATRALVLKTARACFEELGYDGADIRTMAAAMGMSTGAVFANFTGKSELYHAVYGHWPLTPEQGRQLVAVLKGDAVRPAWLNEMAAADAGTP